LHKRPFERVYESRRELTAAAQETWRRARSELEPFLKEQLDNNILMGDLALTNMGLGDKAAAFASSTKGLVCSRSKRTRWMAALQLRLLPG